jgi:hypothetical protein
MRHLFAGDELSFFLDSFFSAGTIAKKVREYPKDKFAAASDAELQQYFVVMFTLTPLQLVEERAYTDDYRDDDVNVDHRLGVVVARGAKTVGLSFSLFIPYVGRRELWFMRPAVEGESHSYARIGEIEGGGAGTVEIPLVHPHDAAPEAILLQRERFVAPIRNKLAAQAQEIRAVMTEIPSRVADAIAARRSLHEVARRVQDALAVPIQRRDGVPPVPLQPRIIRPLPGNVGPKYGIRPEDYEYILQIVRHVGATLERTPKTYRVHNEEELRDMIAANLNGHLMKSVAMEAFSVRGKTDILIEHEGRAAFIAECKIWSGAKQLTKAVAQLFRYTTWQDCKISIIIFNKDVRAFPRVMQSVPAAVTAAFPLVRREDTTRVNEWRLVVASPQHADKQVTVHVFAFNIFAEAAGRLTSR